MLGYLHRWPRAELRILGWGLLLPGWLTVLAAIVSGIVAQGGLPPDAPFRPILNWHTGSGLALAVLYAELLYRGWQHWMRANRAEPDESSPPVDILDQRNGKWRLTLQLLLGIGLVVLSGWLGGHLVYSYGVGVH
ncbi:MAG: DUF2231 domain-containing protein [Caldilineaceae bacterium]|nr:DUF2231 domain-containing protein [Caldilineaceae bacterium]